MALSLFSDLPPKRANLRPVKRRGSKTGFIDMQILTLIKKYPGESVYGIYKRAQEEMPKFYSPRRGDYDKVRNAVNRLEDAGKIKSDITISGGKACRVLTIL